MNSHTIPVRKKIPLPESSYDPAPFLSVLAHEVRNPLTNINLAVEALESMVKDADLKVYFDIILRSSARINGLITQLLTSNLAHMGRGHKYSIHHLLDEVIEMERDRISLKNITVKKEYSLQDCGIVLDKPKMKIALTNIIINAVDAMTPKEGQLTLITKSDNGIPVLQIKDNGCGISKQDLKKIFMTNFSHKPGGLGIGLASTFRILQLNHVGIDVESEEGCGTSFILSFGKKKKPRKIKLINAKDYQRKLHAALVGGLLDLSPIQN